MFLDSLDLPAEIEALVSFFDLTQFLRTANQNSDRYIFELLADYYEFVGEIITDSGGLVIKFMGDGGIMLHPADYAEAGILALLRVQEEGDAWLRERGLRSRNIIKAHFGPVVCGYLGTRDHKQVDIIGRTVNTAATLDSTGLAISTQAFRQLSPDGRKQFKKHTPPITYIPLNQPHS